MSLLIIERGPGQGGRVPLTKFPAVIGRDPQCDVVLADEESSRHHVRIKKRGRLFIVEDLESKNGTFLNGERVLNSILKNGDKLMIGGTELRFLSAETDIHLATEIMNFNMIVAEDIGLSGPIAIHDIAQSEKLNAVRLDQVSILQAADDQRIAREVMDVHSNVIMATSLEEASQILLKSLSHFLPGVSRAAAFLWSRSARQLFPIASRHFQKKKSFILSQRTLEDAIARKQGVILAAGKHNATNPGPERVVLPVLYNDDVTMLIHIEGDDHLKGFTSPGLNTVQMLLLRCAPAFEALSLRQELDAWMMGMIETMVATIEAKDTYTHGHSERVCRYSMAIAEELKLNKEVKRLLMISSLCHDIGKVGVPDTILKKAALLSAEEYNEMKMHPTIGAEIISHMPNAQRFISGIKYHHEKWDGTGYPEGLKGEDIPFFGRIVGLSDVFDAMISGRSYSGFIDSSDAMERLHDEAELFDPEILKAFFRAYESGALTPKTSTQSRQPPKQRKPLKKAK